MYGGTEKFQTDPHWRDHILFYEYFHGDNGAGLGASHQTGWTGLVAKIIQLYRPPGRQAGPGGGQGGGVPQGRRTLTRPRPLSLALSDQHAVRWATEIEGAKMDNLYLVRSRSDAHG